MVAIPTSQRSLIYAIIKFTRLSVVSLTVADALAGWPAILTGWPVTVGVVEVGGVSQPGADAERYRCACWLAGRGDGYQCGLDWGLSI